ncbi:hypothetical protein EJV47_09740 [Hymenobacter gummosus]|uniref:Uncharacterized protein n=1 Tax=Hymenobacter gummosus TaxID=1776032 RepID=A0A3S0QJ28_9BACT|nr:hypothetical protein [Hymenobacter gummosus]RTQ50886.1 hypothetical protein EJV47_09740 [Hymenobacter gummosus]
MLRPPYACLLLPLLLGATTALAQTAGSVGIGTSSPNAKAALDISSTDKGLLIPRLDSLQRASISSPPDGLMVFQTDGRRGFWYAVGGQWVYIPDKTKSGDNLGNHSATRDIGLNDFDLRPRGASDTGHGLGWYGVASSSKNWLGQNIDGPVLYGYAGGALGTSNDGTRLSVLAWRSNGRVGIGAPSPATRLSITPTVAEAKITLWDGGSTTDHYGFGISNSQLNYHVDAAGASHVFYAGGKNGNGAELLRIRGNGRVGIGQSNPQQALDVTGRVQASAGFVTPPAQSYAYSAPRTQYLTLSAFAFASADPAGSPSNTVLSTANTPAEIYLTGSGSGRLLAPVQLPQGATITGLLLRGFDNDGTSATVQARVVGITSQTGGTSYPAAGGSPFAAFSADVYAFQEASQTFSVPVDNTQYGYFVEVLLPRHPLASVVNVRLTYTVTQAE